MEELVASINTSEMGTFPLRKLVDIKDRLKADARRNNLENDAAKMFLQKAKMALSYLFIRRNSIKDICVELKNMYA